MSKLEAVGDYDLKTLDVAERGVDSLFADVKFYRDGWGAGICYDAVRRTQEQFHPSYPGWPIYRVLVHGDERLLKEVVRYGELMADAVAAAEKLNGRPVVAPITRLKWGWVRQAGRDGADYLLHGKFAASLNDRAKLFGVHWKTYKSVRNAVAGGLWVGAYSWRTKLHENFWGLATCEYSRDGSDAR